MELEMELEMEHFDGVFRWSISMEYFDGVFRHSDLSEHSDSYRNIPSR